MNETPSAAASELVKAIEDAWTAIRDHHHHVPEVVVTLGSGSIGRRPSELTLGHFASRRWAVGKEQRSELFIGGEGLRHGARELLTTLLHEAAHGLAHSRGLQDTSRQGRYHNAMYRMLASEVGLDVERDQDHGWTVTTLGDTTAHMYAPILTALESALTMWRHSEADIPNHKKNDDADDEAGEGSSTEDDEEPSPTGPVVLVCSCEKPRLIRMAASVAALGPIVCTLCATPFTPK